MTTNNLIGCFCFLILSSRFARGLYSQVMDSVVIVCEHGTCMSLEESISIHLDVLDEK